MGRLEVKRDIMCNLLLVCVTPNVRLRAGYLTIAELCPLDLTKHVSHEQSSIVVGWECLVAKGMLFN